MNIKPKLRRLLLPAMCAGWLGLGAAEPPRPLTEWFCADLVRAPEETTPEHPVHGALGPTLEWLVLFNATARVAPADVTFYYEDQPPTHLTLTVPAHGNLACGSGDRRPAGEIPMGRLHAARVTSATPLIVQTTRGEREHGGKNLHVQGHSFLSRLGYPGPLGRRETAWAYADSYVTRTNPKHVELEWLTVLNPNPGREAKIEVAFQYGDAVTHHAFTVGAERVRSVALGDLPFVREDGHCGVLVRSDVPVVVEQVRRFMFREHPAPAGTWIVTACPVGDLDPFTAAQP